VNVTIPISMGETHVEKKVTMLCHYSKYQLSELSWWSVAML